MGFDHSRNSLTFRCSAFLAWMRSRECLEEKLLVEMADYEPHSDWETVGFAFLGPLEAAGISLSCHSRWVEQVMQAVHDPQNGVCDAVNTGMAAFRQLAGKAKIEVNKKRQENKRINFFFIEVFPPIWYDKITETDQRVRAFIFMPCRPAWFWTACGKFSQ